MRCSVQFVSVVGARRCNLQVGAWKDAEERHVAMDDEDLFVFFEYMITGILSATVSLLTCVEMALTWMMHFFECCPFHPTTLGASHHRETFVSSSLLLLVLVGES